VTNSHLKLSSIFLGEVQQGVACLEAISRSVSVKRVSMRDDETSSQASSSSSATPSGGRGREVDMSLDFQSATLQAMQGEAGTREMMMLLAQDTQDLMLTNHTMMVSDNVRK